MVQSQHSGIAILVVLHAGIQLFQNSRKIIYICFQRDDLRLDFRILECLFLFDRFKMVVGIALHLERLLYQTAGVCIRGKHIGFDDELSAIPIFGYYILGNIGGGGSDRQHTKKRQQDCHFFHTLHHQPFQSARTSAGTPRASPAQMNLCFVIL